jgi:RNA polymerase sigma factor (sigma-70 family)
MQELDDISLLREYVDHGSEDAFAALVARHVNKVYSIALRHARNPHQAEEIAQAVFVILAGKARQLGSRVILSGWLCRTAQLTAVTFVRSEIRRARREQEAYMQNPLVETESDVWPQIEPLLDAAMAGLSEADYHAVVLRFFDGKSMKEVGEALGASQGAAKMRVTRAVEQLRRFFARRGIVVSVAVLAAAISANSVQSAPATLTKTATAVALAKGTAASTSTLTLIKGVLKIMAWAKAKTAIVAGVAALLVAGTATIVVKKISHPIPASANPLTVQFPPGPRGVGPGHPVSRPNPNARFANLTPEQRVEHARRHFPESVDDLRN